MPCPLGPAWGVLRRVDVCCGGLRLLARHGAVRVADGVAGHHLQDPLVLLRRALQRLASARPPVVGDAFGKSAQRHMQKLTVEPPLCWPSPNKYVS